MKKVLIYIVFLFFTTSFYTQNNFIIKGKIKNCTVKKVWIYNLDKTVSDTVLLTKRGKFEYQGFVKEEDLYYVKPFDNNDYLAFVVKPNSEISYETKILQTSTSNVKAKTKIKKSKSPIVYEYLDKSARYLAEIKKYDDLFIMDVTAEGQFYYDSLVTAKTNEFHIYRNNFIEKNAKSTKVLTALNHLDLSKDLEQLKQMEEGLKTLHSDKEFYKKIQNSIYKIEMHNKKAGNIGEEAPILILPGVNGEDVSLEKLRGNYVLIDFWASWCKPCRAEHPRLVKLYKELKEKGFEIYSISLDSKKERWQNAIDKDGLIWKSHVNDLNSFNSPAVKMYNVGAVPFSVLIDKKGRIIAYNLRGKELESRIRNLIEYQ